MALENWIFIKKLIEVGGIFGQKSKKLTGVNDFDAKMIANNAIFDNNTSTITVPNTTYVPDWLNKKGDFFRSYSGSYKQYTDVMPIQTSENNFKLFKILSSDVIGTNLIIRIDPQFSSVSSGVFNVKLDGRLAVVHNDPNISKLTESGGTMFSVENNKTTGLDDGSSIALANIEHYHPTDAKTVSNISNSIITHELNSRGRKHYTKDAEQNIMVELEPLVVVDNDGNVVISSNNT